MGKKIFTLSALLFFVTVLYGQESNDALIKKYTHLAEKTFAARNYASSIVFHQKLDSLMPGVAEIQYNIGVCYLYSNNKSKALPYFEYAKKKKLANKELNYMLGQAYHYSNQFDKAKKTFEAYLREIKDDTATAAEIKRKIEVCTFAKQLVEDSIPVLIENIGKQVNTKYDEYVPVVSADQQTMYFTSRRPTNHDTKISTDGKYFEDIYITEKDSLGRWKEAKDMAAPVNSEEHDACIGMTADAQSLFIYRMKADQNRGHIYSSKLSGKTWSKPTILGSHINTKKGWEASVSISEDNHKLYFSSDRDGGFGGLDIWYCDLMPNNEWSEPKNIGSSINTKYDEDCPFIHFDDKTLFFSSTGHKTMGGYDVFSTVYHKDSATWSKPRNLGYPINSADDDMYFVYSADGSKGYMSTALRPDSYGERDIYVVNRPKHSKTMIVLNGKVLDEETNKPIEAYITVTDLSNNEVVGVYNSNSITGKYILALDYGKNYSIQFEAPNFIFHSENVSVNNSEAIFQEQKTFKLKHIKAGNSLVLNNIFFDYNKHDIKNESLPEMDKLLDFMQKHQHVYIEISGHTDSVGNDAYNLKLSKMRANTVCNYLVERGIPKKNLRITGYGETRPVASNGTEEGRKLNRRTECLIYDVDALSKEHLDHLSKMDTVGMDEFLVDEVVPNKKVGDTLHTKVHFLYNNGVFLTGFSKEHLDKVYMVLKGMPKMKVKVSASVDQVGSEYNNKALYEKRVHTAINYLLEKGISADRLVVVPFQPVTSQKVDDLTAGNLERRKVQFVLAEF